MIKRFTDKFNSFFHYSDHNLIKWQIISFVSRGIAMCLGIVQSFFIVRLLTVGEWGLVQIAVSIGGALGIYQHLGLSSGSTREISAAKDDEHVFKLFATSLFIRYLITLPIAIGLFFFSSKIAIGSYNQPALILPLKIYALILVAQGLQSILNSVISGTKRFKRLFIYQALIAVVSVVIYIPLVFVYRINGFFYAMFLFNCVSSLVLAYLALKPLKTRFVFPDRKDFRTLLKELLSISMGIYFVKIIYTMWEKSGPILLGLQLTPELVGFFAFALLYAKKIVNISDAVTDVNLAVLSERFVHDFEAFKKLFADNFDKIFTLIILGVFSAIYWSPEVTGFVVGSSKYVPSIPYILPLTFAFATYSFINIVNASVLIPAKMVKEMMAAFLIMLIATIGFFFAFLKVSGPLTAMSYGMLAGALIGFGVMILFSQTRLKFTFWKFDHMLILLQGVVISISGSIPYLPVKFSLFAVYISLYVWGVVVAKFVDTGKVRSKLLFLKREPTDI